MEFPSAKPEGTPEGEGANGFKCSWLWHATSPFAPDAKKKLWRWKKCQQRDKTVWKCTKKCYNLHTPRELVSVPILPSSRLMFARNAVKFWGTFVMLTTSNQFRSHIFRSTFLKLVVAAQDSFKPLSRNSWMVEVEFFITTNFQPVIRGAQGHPTGNMI